VKRGSITLLLAGAVIFAALSLAAPASTDIDLKGARLLKTHAGGVKEYLLADKSRATIWPNGKTRRAMPDGTIRETKPDGSVWESTNAQRDLVDPNVVEMAPWPSRIKQMDRVVFSGALKRGYHSPWACVLLPSGNIREIKTESFKIRGNRFSLSLLLSDGVGSYKVEIIVKSRLGHRVALNVSIWAGMDPLPSMGKTKLFKTVDPKEPLHRLEPEFYKIINRERKKRDIARIRWDAEAGQLARHMARELTYERFFGHRSPKWGNIAQRAVKLNKWTSVVYGVPKSPPKKNAPNFIADDLIKTRSLGSAMVTLLESPAHRRVLLGKHFTHAGVGISRLSGGDGRDIVMVVVMLQLNRPKRTRKPPKKIRKKDDSDDTFHIYGRP